MEMQMCACIVIFSKGKEEILFWIPGANMQNFKYLRETFWQYMYMQAKKEAHVKN